MEFEELLDKVVKFNNKNIVNTVLPHPKFIDKSKGNRYELDQFNWTMQKRNYFQNLRNEIKGFKKKEYISVNSLDEVQDMMLKNALSQKWTRLEKHHKLKQISEYLTSLDIDKKKMKDVKIYIYGEFNKGSLKSSKSVNYNQEECKIMEIPLLVKYINTLNKL